MNKSTGNRTRKRISEEGRTSVTLSLLPLQRRPAVRSTPGQSQRQVHRPRLSRKCSTGVEEDQTGLAGVELRNGSGPPDPASLDPDDRAGWTSPTHKLITRFRAVSGASAALVRRVGLRGATQGPQGLKSLISTGLCYSGTFPVPNAIPRNQILVPNAIPNTSNKEQVVGATSPVNKSLPFREMNPGGVQRPHPSGT